MKNKMELEQLLFELNRLETEYESLNKRTFLAILYYEATIKTLKHRIEKLKKTIGE